MNVCLDEVSGAGWGSASLVADRVRCLEGGGLAGWGLGWADDDDDDENNSLGWRPAGWGLGRAEGEHGPTKGMSVWIAGWMRPGLG